METLRDHTLAWLESIGADGLMYPDTGAHKFCWTVDEAFAIGCVQLSAQVPAFRHADGSYHAEAEAPDVCVKMKCCEPRGDKCECKNICEHYQTWLSHKEAK